MNESQPDSYGLGMKTNALRSISTYWPATAFALVGKGLNLAFLVPEMDLLIIRSSNIPDANNQEVLLELAKRAERLVL